jgi:hypothetical protein
MEFFTFFWRALEMKKSKALEICKGNRGKYYSNKMLRSCYEKEILDHITEKHNAVSKLHRNIFVGEGRERMTNNRT